MSQLISLIIIKQGGQRFKKKKIKKNQEYFNIIQKYNLKSKTSNNNYSS